MSFLAISGCFTSLPSARIGSCPPQKLQDGFIEKARKNSLKWHGRGTRFRGPSTPVAGATCAQDDRDGIICGILRFTGARLRTSSVYSLLVAVFAFILLGTAGASEPDAAFLLQNGKANQALQVLNARIQKDANDAQAYNLMARVYFQLEHWDDAIHAAEKSIALAPDVSEYHQWLARACGEKAESAGAVTAFNLVRRVKSEFEKAVTLDADGKNLSARVDLAEFYIEAPYVMGGDKTKARHLADFVMEHDPALAHYMLAKLEEKQNSRNRAEKEYQAAIESSGNKAKYWVSLGSFYRRTGRPEDMESAINKSLTAKQDEGVPLFDGASQLLTAGRNFPQAIQMLRRYLSLDDPVEDGPAFQAHYFLGLLLEKQGDGKAAAVEYRAALALASDYRPAQDALTRLTH